MKKSYYDFYSLLTSVFSIVNPLCLKRKRKGSGSSNRWFGWLGTQQMSCVIIISSSRSNTRRGVLHHTSKGKQHPHWLLLYSWYSLFLCTLVWLLYLNNIISRHIRLFISLINIKWINSNNIILGLTLALVHFQKDCKPDEDLVDIGIFYKFYKDENRERKKKRNLVILSNF